MEQKSQPTVEEKIPQAAALSFIKGQVSKVAPKNDRVGKKETTDSVTAKNIEPSKAAPKKTSRPKQDAQKAHEQYVLFSTKLRRSLQRQLAELRHKREMAGHPVRTIKQFIEESVTLWLKTAGSSSEVGYEKQRMEASGELDPLEPFNNQIRADLKRELKEISHRREMAGHPAKTIIAIIDEAINGWLATSIASGQTTKTKAS